eukprot:GSChrysophyteH1.ASY1.ANO1.492.1 assembled CDS
MPESRGADARQSELMELQRQYRNMELNRRQYAEESQTLLRKQQSTIDKLRKDNDGIKADIAMIMRSSNRPMGAAQQENLQRLHDAVAIMKQKLLHQRRAMGGVNASKDNHFMIQKQIRILENRLEKALVKFNEAIANNKGLRDQIDDLRRERVVFESIYRKMERELHDRKQKMAEIIELSNQSYETRDKYQMEVAAIEQANRKENEEFEEQMMELGRMLENELNNTANSDANSIERVQNFEEAFNKIKQATGISDVEELVRTFIKNEDHNFSLFNYVNEQNNEIEKYEEQIQALREEERKFAQESGDDVHQHKQILKELESKLASSESMSEKYEVRCQDLQRVVESLKRGLQSTYDKLDIPAAEDEDINSSAAVLGDAAVSETNMVHYLGVIEQKANRLLQVYAEVRQAQLTMKKEEEDKKSNSSELLNVNPPKVEEYQSDDEDDDDEDDTRPLTRDELKTRTMNKLQRRGGGNKTKKPKKPNQTR